MFAKLRKIAFKLALLAGTPLVGTLLLAAQVALGARAQAKTAECLGSIEDLAELSARIAHTLDELQLERATAALSIGLRAADSPDAAAQEAADAALAAQETRTEAEVHAMDAFLAQRDLKRLPPRLGGDLTQAHAALERTASKRPQFALGAVTIAELLSDYASTNDALIDATAALTQLSNDGEMLRALSSLVAAMHVQECDSREHAVLSHTFAKGAFDPGQYRHLVTLITEQGVHAAALRGFATPDQAESYQRMLARPEAIESARMLERALNATEDNLDIDANAWFKTQRAKVHALSAITAEQAAQVHQIARSKVADARRTVRYSEALAAGVLLISVLMAVVLGRGITRSVLSLANVADRVRRAQDFSLRAVRTSSDEIGTLTDAFNEMISGIQSRDRNLGEHRESLEQTVAERTCSLWTRTEQMRLVLDTVKQGLATLDRRGRVCVERSHAFDSFFGPGAVGQPYYRHIARGDSKLALALELDWIQITEGNMPLEVALGQAKSRIQVGDRHFSLSYTPIRDGEEVAGALLTVSDVTADLIARRAEAAQREQVKVFMRIIQDRAGFLDFFSEAQRLVASIGDNQFSSPADKLRAVHTLKGNTALFDVGSVAEAAHALEQAIADQEPGSEETAVRVLAATWDSFVSGIQPVWASDSRKRYEVSRDELDEMLCSLREGRSSNVERLIGHIQGDTIGKQFERVAGQLKTLSQQLGKGEPEILVSGTEIRLPHARFAAFWSALAHVVSNVADHGLQSAEERSLLGKPPRNRVLLSARLEAKAVVIEISDDGRGVDWRKVAERAHARGWAHRTRAELVEAVFAPGFSTAEAVSEISGRGVGMSAVLEACRALDGQCAIQSDVGQGTKLTFMLPLAPRGAELLAQAAKAASS